MFLYCGLKKKMQPAHLSLIVWLSQFSGEESQEHCSMGSLPDSDSSRTCASYSHGSLKTLKLHTPGVSLVRTIVSIYCPVSNMTVITTECSIQNTKPWTGMMPGDGICVHLKGNIAKPIWFSLSEPCSVISPSKCLQNLGVRAVQRLAHKHLINSLNSKEF